VEGGATGFRPGSAIDLQNQLDQRGQWHQRATPNVAVPFDPRRPGPAPTDAGQPRPGAQQRGDGAPMMPGPGDPMTGPGGRGPNGGFPPAARH
jgi:hypothetical protein